MSLNFVPKTHFSLEALCQMQCKDDAPNNGNAVTGLCHFSPGKPAGEQSTTHESSLLEARQDSLPASLLWLAHPRMNRISEEMDGPSHGPP